MDVPKTLDWKQWLSGAADRPDNKGYLPHNWRGCQDFGAGALGDMACHIMDPVFWSLRLNEAEWYTVETVDIKDKNDHTFPSA